MADALYSTVEAVNHARFASGAIAIPIKTSRGQSFVHLDDVVDALRATVARRATLRHEASILIGESEPLSYDELQRLLAGHIHGDAD